MKVGDKIPCFLEIVREMQDGEEIVVDGKPQQISNLRRNKFWAVPWGNKEGPELLVCCDLETEAKRSQRAALVTLIQLTD